MGPDWSPAKPSSTSLLGQLTLRSIFSKL
uniref:Uncharacterized protein n=1 Tax=Anguilla anguilla TaxID=7936 RepID=A0A0E9PTZ0_ANGAN